MEKRITYAAPRAEGVEMFNESSLLTSSVDGESTEQFDQIGGDWSGLGEGAAEEMEEKNGGWSVIP